MSGGSKLLWYVLGALSGWLAIWVIALFGGAAIGALATIFIWLFPIFAIIGFGFVLYVLFRGPDKQ